MSPAAASAISTRFSPSKANSLVTRSGCTDPSSFSTDDRGIERDASVEDAADGDAPEVVARVEVGDQHLQRGLRIADRRRHLGHDRIEQGPQALARHGEVGSGRPRAPAGVEDRELDLVLGGVEIDEEVVDLVQHFLRARVGAIDLVDHHDRRQSALERLAQHEAGLRQRALGRVHEQHHAVHHRQHAFDFPAEVGVARRIDDVDQHVAVVDGGVLGQDGDAALALQLVAVHGPLGDPLVGSVDAGLPEHRIDQRGLAVVHVGDDRDVAAEGVGDAL